MPPEMHRQAAGKHAPDPGQQRKDLAGVPNPPAQGDAGRADHCQRFQHGETAGDGGEPDAPSECPVHTSFSASATTALAASTGTISPTVSTATARASALTPASACS